MVRIGLVSQDERLKAELRKWLGELFDEFEIEMLGPPKPAGPPATADPIPEAPVEPKPPIKLIFFDASHGFPYDNSWNLKDFRQNLALGDAPWLAIGHDDLSQDPHGSLIDGCDDLVAVPLDRLVLLQKIEFLLAGEAAVSPSFLYQAKADFAVELGKTVHLIKLSEAGCTIRSKRPLAYGVEGTLISGIFGAGPLSKVEVQVFESRAKVDSKTKRTEYEVRLVFFGLKHVQLKNLRRTLPKMNPIASKTIEPKEHLHVALLSPDPTAQAVMVQNALEGLAKIDIIEFKGLRTFLASLMHDPKSADNALEKFKLWHPEFIGPKRPEDMIPALPAAKISVYLRLPDLKVERIEPEPHSTTILGANKEQWFRDSGVLTAGISESDKSILLEAFTWAAENSKNKKPVSHTATYTVGNTARVNLHYSIAAEEAQTPVKGALLKVDLELAPIELLAKLDPKSNTIEAVLIDASLLYGDFVPRLEQVQTWIRTYEVKNVFGNMPPVMVINADEDRVQPADLRGSGVRQLAYGFIDRRFHTELFLEMSRSEFWTSTPPSMQIHDTDIEAFMTRPGRADAISEVGLTVIDKVAMKRGTDLLVLSPLLPNAPNGVWARLRSVTDRGEGQFANEFIFFGISDLMQKEIRKFVRDDYIRKKAKDA